MQIKKISINAHGLRGISVEYLTWETTKDGHRLPKTIVEKPKRPVHLGLEKLFKDLRVNLLECCRIIGSSGDAQDIVCSIQESELTSISFSEDSFILGGSLMAFNDKFIKLKTPKIENTDEYEGFDAVMSKINEICVETKEYLQGNKKPDDQEVVIRWIQAGKSKVEMGEFENMSAEEKKQFCTEFLEKEFGSFVVHGDDVTLTDESATETAVEPIQTEWLLEDGKDNVIPITGHKRPEAAQIPEQEAF